MHIYIQLYQSEGLLLTGYFPGGGRWGGGGGPCPEILSSLSSLPSPRRENPDGNIDQDGNLLFQKCLPGLGDEENGLDLFKCWF